MWVSCERRRPTDQWDEYLCPLHIGPKTGESPMGMRQSEDHFVR